MEILQSPGKLERVCLCQLIGVWIISEWMGAGQPKQLQLVELGPGRGSLSSDVLRVRAVILSVVIVSSAE